MDFATWFRSWMTRHPVHLSSQRDCAGYTAEVMARVHAIAPQASGSPKPRWSTAWRWPRVAFALTTAAVMAVVIVGVRRASTRQLAQAVTEDTVLLAALEDPAEPSPMVNGIEGLADELEVTDHLLLAESPGDEERWLEETLQVLNELDDEFPTDPALEASPDATGTDEWLDELRDLDDEFAASS